jgi:hypothetical protein
MFLCKEVGLENPKKKTHYGKPGALALARYQADGDWAAGALLYRVKFHFSPQKKRLTRFGLEWVAMSRHDWATEAGLSDSEMNNRALPKLRARPFMEIRAMKLSPNGPKLLWIHLDLVKMHECTHDDEMVEKMQHLNPGKMLGPGLAKPKTNYPYKKKK